MSPGSSLHAKRKCNRTHGHQIWSLQIPTTLWRQCAMARAYAAILSPTPSPCTCGRPPRKRECPCQERPKIMGGTRNRSLHNLRQTYTFFWSLSETIGLSMQTSFTTCEFSLTTDQARMANHPYARCTTKIRRARVFIFHIPMAVTNPCQR